MNKQVEGKVKKKFKLMVENKKKIIGRDVL